MYSLNDAVKLPIICGLKFSTSLNQFLCNFINYRQANCTNSVGSYSCVCNTGYSGNGMICDDIDECSTVTCPANSDCNNTVGSYRCECNPGFTCKPSASIFCFDFFVLVIVHVNTMGLVSHSIRCTTPTRGLRKKHRTGRVLHLRWPLSGSARHSVASNHPNVWNIVLADGAYSTVVTRAQRWKQREP